jgi:hypothetical protein
MFPLDFFTRIMPECLLDRDQVHATEIELARAEVAQHMRGQPARPLRQMPAGGLG